MTRRPGIILLLLIYACTQLGSIAWYYYKPLIHAISVARQHQVALGDHPPLLTIEMDAAAFRKAKQNENEIRWQGTLCDIQHISYRGATVVLSLLKDEEETSWLHQYDLLSYWLHQDGHDGRSPVAALWKWFSKIYNPVPAITCMHLSFRHKKQSAPHPVPYHPPLFAKDLSRPPLETGI